MIAITVMLIIPEWYNISNRHLFFDLLIGDDLSLVLGLVGPTSFCFISIFQNSPLLISYNGHNYQQIDVYI